MDASASAKPDADTTMFNFFININDIGYTTPLKQKSSVIKYTKLPDFDFDSKGKAVAVVIFFSLFHGFP